MLFFLELKMDGIILINKEKGKTSRDIVNQICKKFNTRKVGHTGTLDPLATGLMVVCLNDGLKLVELLTGHDKEYIAKVTIGIQTDTYDITGNIIKEEKNISIKKEELVKTLNSFIGSYNQVVPKYSAIKVQGKKLYEYARSNIDVELPSHLVHIKKIELLDLNSNSFTFRVLVSSGTYIRSLINDIGEKLNIPMTMEELTRTKVGEYLLEDASTLDNIRVIPIIDALNIRKIEVDEKLLKKVSNGVRLQNIYHEEYIMFTYHGRPVSIYQNEGEIIKSYRVFNLH